MHAALTLVATLFGVAVLFVAQDAHFLAAVQVIVYAGAIVVLFLFVIMLLGVDQAEDLAVEPLAGQRAAAAIVGIGVLGLSLVALAVHRRRGHRCPLRGRRRQRGRRGRGRTSTSSAESLFTDYVFAFEITSVLLVIAVVGAVVLSRKVRREDRVEDPLAVAHAAELEPSAAAARSGEDDDAEADAEEVEA